MKTSAETDVRGATGVLTSVSHEPWEHPELAFEEEHAAAVCVEALTDAGFDVTTGVAGLETSFVAEYGSGPLVVGICAELDALPGVGHACGHKIIAASGVGAGMGLARIADEAGITIRVLGTPAEEGGGGKIIMLEDGICDGLHLAMMVHPAPMESDVFPALAATECEYHMHGKSAHSSLAPPRRVSTQPTPSRWPRSGSGSFANICTPATRSTALSPTLAMRPTSSRRTRPPATSCGVRRSPISSGSRHGSRSASRRGRWRPAPPWRSRITVRPILSSSTTKSWRCSTARMPRAWAAPSFPGRARAQPRPTWRTCRC